MKQFKKSRDVKCRKQLNPSNVVEKFDVCCPPYEIGDVFGLFIENNLATNDLMFNILSDVLQQLFVNFRSLSLEHKSLVLKNGRPIGHVLIFFRAKKPNLVEPSQLLAHRQFIKICFLCYVGFTSSSLLSDIVSSIILGSFFTLFKIHKEVEIRVDEW